MLFLETMGGLSVTIDGVRAGGAGRQRKSLALLALVAAGRRRGISRDKLIALLWPECDTRHGRGLLKQACYALRRDLHARDLFLGRLEVQLNPVVIASDVQTLDEALQRNDLERAVAVYTGSFLDGFYLTGADEFERYIEAIRGELRQRVGEAYELLALQAEAAGDARCAVRCWRRLASLEPLRSHVALGLLRALVAAGEGAEALAFGRMHERLLRSQLGAAPDAAVVRLVQQLERVQPESVLVDALDSKRRSDTT